MQNAITDLPLAIFTTLAPIGAGGFVALAAILICGAVGEEQIRKIDRFSFIPFIVVALGFIASLFHLTNLANIFHVFAGLGTSPLSNEIATGAVFLVLAFVYCVLAALGKLSGAARKGFAAVVGIFALIFAAFCGSAYMVDTIPSWNNPFSALSIMGFCLLGGMFLGTLLLGLAGSLEDAKNSSYKSVALALTVFGFVLAVIGVLGQLILVSGITTPSASGASLVSDVIVFAIIFGVGALVATICQIWLFLGKGKGKGKGEGEGAGLAPTTAGLALSAVAVFVARLVFYALEMNVGL